MRTATLGLMAAAVALSAACGNLERSRDLANPAVSATTLAQQVCSNCHGMTGSATSPNFPNLAGQTEPYLVAQLNGFKSRSRHNAAGFAYMWGLTRSLSEGQINGLAAYYSAQLPLHQTVEADASRLDAGRKLFTQGVPEKGIPACLSCHGPQGKGNATFPQVAGQQADYIVKQLIVFQRTDERPEGRLMKTVALDLTLQDIQDVAGFMQALPQPQP